MTNYKPLATDFTRKGWSYTQEKRVKDCAIYRVKAPHWPRPCYEVIHIRKRNARKTFGKDIAAHEKYPSDEDWGYHGWTCTDEKAANRRFELLVKALDTPKKPTHGTKLGPKTQNEGLGSGTTIKTPCGTGCQ